MITSLFGRVREAFVSNFEGNARMLGLQLKGKAGEWHNAKCPLCSDSSGSARISERSGFLQCFQCGEKLELFSWFRRLQGYDSDVAARNGLAELLHVDLALPKRKGGKPPKDLTEDLLLRAQEELFSEDAGEYARRWLRDRKLYEPTILARLGVGSQAGRIIIAQRTVNGALIGQHRRIVPTGKKLWSGGDGSVRTVQPYCPVPTVREWKCDPKVTEIAIFEGETDGLTAWTRSQLWRQNILPFWIPGVTVMPLAEAIPEDWKGRRVDIFTDNDTFQGPDASKYLAPDKEKRAEMMRRREKLLEFARMLSTLGCRVYLRAIPLNPVDKWGGDFRDWVDAGGKDLTAIPAWKLEVVLEHEIKPRLEVPFEELVKHTGVALRVRAKIRDLGEPISMPERTTISCPMGSIRACSQCLVPQEFPSQIIHWTHKTRLFAACVTQRNFDDAVMDRVMQKPPSCKRAELIHSSTIDGYVFGLGPLEDSAANSQPVTVYSPQKPPLTGAVDVEGIAYSVSLRTVMMARKVTEVSSNVALDDHVADLLTLAPPSIDTTRKVWETLSARADDLAAHVTKIHGRRDIHIAFDLVSHSALGFKMRGGLVRGWLDANVIGPTRTGKSFVARRLSEYYGDIEFHAQTKNVSVAGLTMGMDMAQRGQRAMMKPGLFPRADGRMLVVDEFHNWPPKLILELQNTRDVGEVHSAKIYGASKIPARVRLLTISNERDLPLNYLCEHVQQQYVTKESLARMDFALGVPPLPEETALPMVQHAWTSELCTTLLRRAWMLTENDVEFEEGIDDLLAGGVSDLESAYYDELPLFTREEKPNSVLRVAVAAANILFSHPKGHPERCLVRRCHVEFALEWLDHTYRSVAYDAYSVDRRARDCVSEPLRAEATLYQQIDGGSPVAAQRLVAALFEGVQAHGCWAALTEVSMGDAVKWFQVLTRLGVLRLTRGEFRVTKGGAEFLSRLSHLSASYPDAFQERWERFGIWRRAVGQKERGKLLPAVTPLTAPREILEDEWSGRQEELYATGQGTVDFYEQG